MSLSLSVIVPILRLRADEKSPSLTLTDLSINVSMNALPKVSLYLSSVLNEHV